MMLIAAIAFALSSQPIHLAAADAILDGPHLATSRRGYSGKGYITDLTKEGARITWHFKADRGIYDLKVAYSASGAKGFQMRVNGCGVSGMLPATGDGFGVRDAGKVNLKPGENEVSFERGWGYFDVNCVDLVPAGPPPRLKPLKPVLVDPKATPEARKLFARLLSRYGKVTFSGQYEPDECAFVQKETGKTPAILGGDLIDYSPSRIERMKPPAADDVPGWIAATKRGQVLTLSWHWNAPTDLIDEKKHKMPDGRIEDASWDRGFYTVATTFDVRKALSDPSGEDYKLILRDIDAIAVQLKRLQDAHVPVLWRPLHEAEGGWFWWGAKGPDVCKKLWRLLFDRLTKYHGLHNLIWVWNSPSLDWSPGEDAFDIMSLDEYPDEPRDALSPQWEDQLALYNGRKPLALAEFPGAPDIERMRMLGVRWLYFVSWSGSVGPKSTPPDILRSTYRSKNVVDGPGTE